MELKDLRFNLKVRVYGEGYKTHISHSFCVDDMPMGVSAPVGEFIVDVRSVTLQQLRPMLMYDIRGAMKRRSMLWQEVLFIFGRLPNMYDRPKSEINKYQFGFVRKNKLEDIQLIHPSRETVPIAELIGATDFFNHDLVIVPVTQLDPSIVQAMLAPLPGSEARPNTADRPGSTGGSRPGSTGSNRAGSAERKARAVGPRASSPGKPGSATSGSRPGKGKGK